MVAILDTAAIRSEIEASIDAKKRILESDTIVASIYKLGNECANCLARGGKIIIAGNGGSFADSQHLAAEFISKLKIDRGPLPAVALGTNNSSLSAIGNDYGFDYIFSRELEVIGSKGDVFIPITTSGNSPNILKAVQTANRVGIKTIGLTGSSGGKLAEIADCLVVPSDSVARIQECHILIGHIICGIAEQGFLK